MAKLEHSVYVAPSKLVASDDFPPGEDREMWSPTASTLIHGERDAVLVDPLMTKDESRALAAWVVATGKNVTAIFVTHAHGDHFFGAPAVLERFPDAKVVAAPGVAARMDAQYGPRWLDGFWNARFPGQISGQRVTAEPLTDGLLELEGEQLRAIELGHTDTDGTSALHVPSTGLVVAGDAVYGDVKTPAPPIMTLMQPLLWSAIPARSGGRLRRSSARPDHRGYSAPASLALARG